MQTTAEILADAHTRLGGSIRPPKAKTVVRTLPPPAVTAGGIHITDQARRFYKGSPAHHQVDAVVIASDTFTPGARVRFARTHFASLQEVPSAEPHEATSYLGLIPTTAIYGQHSE